MASGRDEDLRIVYEITRVLERRATLMGRVLRPVPLYAASIGCVILAILQALTGYALASTSIVMDMGFLLAMIGLAATIVAGGLGSTLHLTLRHETSTFWSRNAEKLLIAAIGAIGGIAAKALADWIAKR